MAGKSGGDPTVSWSYIGTALPSGVDSGDLVALYQFDETVDYLTDRSGNGRDLSINGTGTEPYLQVNQNLVGRQYYDDNNGHFTYTAIDASIAPMAIGAFTIELLLSTTYTGDDDVYVVVGGRNPDVEIENFLFCISARLNSAGVTNQIRVFHEYGAGTEENMDSKVSIPIELHHFVVTKAADGVTYKIYINGIHLETLVGANVATGGGNCRISIGDPNLNTATPDMTIMSARFISAELTAAQVSEAYRSVRV